MIIAKKVSTLPVVDSNHCLQAVVCRGDLKKNKKFNLASKDKNNSLLCGAAIGTRPADKDRAALLIEAGVDVIIIDSSNGTS